jgi:Fe-S-cluster containining protein
VPPSEPQPSPWYADGLAFTCTRCGDCCTGAPGYVWVNSAEIAALAARVGVGEDEFTRRFVRRVGPRLSLIEHANGDCVFWRRGEGCAVYEARPTQCRTWPFWDRNLATPESWAHTCEVCPGSGQGRLYSIGEIREALGGPTK